MSKNLNFVILFTLFVLGYSESCTNREVIDGYDTYTFATSQSIISDNPQICTTYASNSCCNNAFVNFAASKYTEMKNNLQTTFDNSMATYKTLYSYLRAQSYNITRLFADAYPYSYQEPRNTAIGDAEVFFLKDALANYQNAINTAQTTFQTCSNSILSHYSGFMCAHCSPGFLTNFVYSNLTYKIDVDVCYKFMKDCVPYINARQYLASVTNVMLVAKQFTVNYATYTSFILNQDTNFTTKVSFANILRNINNDLYRYPPNCAGDQDCTYVCSELLGDSFTLNYNLIANPTPRQSYSPTSIARILHEELYNDIQDEESRRMLQNYIGTTSKINFVTDGFNTLNNGGYSNTGLDPTVSISQVSGSRLVLSLISFVIACIVLVF